MWALPYRGGPGEGEGGTGQALLVAGGGTPDITSSVLTLLPSATSWTPLSPLPRRLYGAPSSMVGGRLWLVGGVEIGRDGCYTRRAEVGNGGQPIALVPRCSSTSPPRTPGHPGGTSQGRGMATAWWPWAHRTSPASQPHNITRARAD